MKAAVVRQFGQAPVYAEAVKPAAEAGEVRVRVRAAALSNLVRGQAAGSHYSAGRGTDPFTPGNDGVGVTEDGRRVYFISPRAPFGSMAEYTVVRERTTIALPDGLDDVTAAALGNPGIATWGPLLSRARLEPGETVLVNGATGAAGQQAVQVAKYLGAGKIIATGRNEAALERLRGLGADETISLGLANDELEKRFRETLEGGVNIVLDYLWGPSAEALLKAAAGRGSADGEPRVRFVQIGAIGGDPISISGSWLRSSGVELMGSGLGSLSAREIIAALTRMFHAGAEVQFHIDTEAVPLREVEAAWARKGSERRIVFVP